MSDLRERFRALDALDVPDVMSRARLMGPKPPEPDPTPPFRRVGALVFAAVVAIAAVVLIARALNEPAQPADPPTPRPSDSALRRDGEVITYTNEDARGTGDLVAVDPDTGEVRTLVAADELSRPSPRVVGGVTSVLIGSAAWSADGRWVAYEVLGCDTGRPSGVQETGLWVTNGLDEPRQLTTRPCSEDRDLDMYNELWEWSPAGVQLLVARRSIDGDALVLIDPATGDRTDLGEAAGDVTSLAWSPDGTRIAYGAVPTGTRDEYSPTPRGSVYSVGVGGGDHSLLASSLGSESGGEIVSAIRWSPDGERIAVVAYVPGPRPATLYLMNADGSDLDPVTEGVVIEHVLGSPGPVWSPDGTRMTYATLSGEPEELQIWNGSPDGSAPVLVFESAPAPAASVFRAGPVWSSDGTRIAFPFSTSYLVANADGVGDAGEIDELRYLSWRGGWYFCECYG